MEHFLEATRAKDATHAPRRVLTRAQIKAIAKACGGQSEPIGELVKSVGLRRHQVIRAAKRGGYRPNQRRKSWTSDEDRFLHEHWGRLAVEVIAQTLERSIQSITLRKKRLGVVRAASTLGRFGTWKMRIPA